MTLHQLKIFAAVAKHLNVTKASEELHISQPSVSQQLKLLQEEYGAKLHEKTSRGIQLTDEGRAFLKDVERILLQVDRLKEKFGSSPARQRAKSFTVGGSFGPSASLLPSLLAVFKETHPQVELTLQTDTSHAVERLVLNAEVEIAVITNPSHSPSLIYEPCRQVKLVTFASPQHPLAKQAELTLTELAQAPLVIKKGKPNEGRARRFLRQLEKRGLQLNIVMECESLEAVKAAVRAGMGIGILYGDIVEPDIQRGDLKMLRIRELKMEISSLIIYKKERPLSSYAQDFLTLVRELPRKRRWVNGPLQAP